MDLILSLHKGVWKGNLFFFFSFHRLYNREGQGERVRALLVAETVKNPPAIQETLVQFLGQEDLLEKRMFTHSGILAWRIPWTEEPGRLLFMGSQRIGNDSAFHFTFKEKEECVWPVHGLLHGAHPLYTIKGLGNPRMYFLGLPLQLKSVCSAVTYSTPYLKIHITVSLGCTDITGKFHQTRLAMGPKCSIT